MKPSTFLETAGRPVHRVRLALTIAAALVVSACAHPMAIGPDISRIERDASLRPIERNVGYYIAPHKLEESVNTPGGGGDSVTYKPYRDIEAAFYKMLGNVFAGVTKLKSPNDAEAIGRNSISYVITPEITTNSSSSSIFTWPPTQFTVYLTCSIADQNGTPVTRTMVTGNGQAEFEEFKSDFSLSGKRAALDAILKMQDALLRHPELQGR